MMKLTAKNIPLTKKSIKKAGERFADQVLAEGDRSPLFAFMQLRALKSAIDEALDGVKGEALEEASRFGKDDRSWRGVGFSLRDGRTYYDYSHDGEWRRLKEEERELKKRIKKREAFLRSLEQEMVVPETGEYVSPATIKSFGSPILAITFPKE